MVIFNNYYEQQGGPVKNRFTILQIILELHWSDT